MNIVTQAKLAAHLAEQGLTEERIGIRLGVHRLKACRLLALRPLDADIARTLKDARISYAALREIAGYPAEAQSLALGDLRLLVVKKDGHAITRREVARVLALRWRDLDRAPFPTTACRRCYSRTGAQPDLFGGVEDGRLGRCHNAACFARCLNAVSARRARWANHDKTQGETNGTQEA